MTLQINLLLPFLLGTVLILAGIWLGWRYWRRRIGLAGAVLLVLAGAGMMKYGFFVREATLPLQELQDRRVPEFRYRMVGSGKVESTAEWRGEVVLLNFWATWCGPCRTELPALGEAAKQLRTGQRMVALSDETADRVASYLGTVKQAPPVAVAERGDGMVFLDRYGVRPVTFLIDRDGVIRDTFIGPLSAQRALEMLGRY